MKTISMTEEVLLYSKKTGSTLRLTLDEDGNLVIETYSIKLKIAGKGLWTSPGDYEMTTDADVA